MNSGMHALLTQTREHVLPRRRFPLRGVLGIAPTGAVERNYRLSRFGKDGHPGFAFVGQQVAAFAYQVLVC